MTVEELEEHVRGAAIDCVASWNHYDSSKKQVEDAYVLYQESCVILRRYQRQLDDKRREERRVHIQNR